MGSIAKPESLGKGIRLLFLFSHPPGSGSQYRIRVHFQLTVYVRLRPLGWKPIRGEGKLITDGLLSSVGVSVDSP